MLVTLYKATDRTDSFASGAAFAANEEDAEAYLDNPGYGGSELISVEVEVARDEILSLVAGQRNGVPHGHAARYAWDLLGEALGLDEEGLRALRDTSGNLIEQAIDSRKIRSQLAAAEREGPGFVTSFDGPGDPDDDFIDLDALAQNVAAGLISYEADCKRRGREPITRTRADVQ